MAALVGLVRGAARDAWGRLTRVERAIVGLALVLRVVGIGWGLPASDGWDVDGIAPRDFLPGVVETFTPGHYFTYPPLHLLFLTVLTLPVTLAKLATVPSFAPATLIPAFLDPRVMTAFALVARLVNVAMSLVLLVTVGEIAGLAFGRRARAWAMAIAATEAALTYYAHATNLDVPALAWAALALHRTLRAVEDDAPRKLTRAGLFAAFAIATKDQSYAFFALTMPVVLGAWLVRRRQDRAELVLAGVRLALVVAAVVLVVDGAVLNPTGFLARLRFLTGPASQDFASFSKDAAGVRAVLVAAFGFLPEHHYPLLVGLLALVGVGLAAAGRGRDRLLALAPLVAILSYTLAFNCVARRVEERFLLPQMQLVAVYAGGALALGEEAVRARWARLGVRAVGALALVHGLWLAVIVDGNLLEDPRYDMEAWLAREVAPGDVVETYGNNVYLPRFPVGASVQRVGASSPRSRNPLPGVVELRGSPADIEDRKPRFVVVSEGHVWRYLQSVTQEGGAMTPAVQQRTLGEEAATSAWFRALFAGETGYALAHTSTFAARPWLPRRRLHGALGSSQWVFVRRP